MKILTCNIKENEAFIIPIGDLHIGDKGFTKESFKKLKETIEFVEKTPTARVFLNGDLLNCSTRISKTSPYDQNMDLSQQKEELVRIFDSIKDKIIGAVSGNHEQRMEDFCGDNPLREVCYRLNIPYFGYTAIIDFRLGWREDKKQNLIQYTGLFHHTTGGGQTIGSKVNRVEKLRTICHNADLFCGSHNHMLGAIPVIAPEFNLRAHRIENRVQMLIDCGSYLEWNNSYAEAKALEPVKMGSPIIRLDGKKKDIKISL